MILWRGPVRDPRARPNLVPGRPVGLPQRTLSTRMAPRDRIQRESRTSRPSPLPFESRVHAMVQSAAELETAGGVDPKDKRATGPPRVDKSDERVRRMFASIAHRYDFLNHFLSLNIDRSWRRYTTRVVPPVPGVPVLDCCTGTADLALAYDRAAQGHVPVIATDFCRQMLDLGRAKVRRRGAESRVLLIEGDTQRLPVPEDTFGVVSIAFGLRNVSDARRGIDEMIRAARPGGKVAILEFFETARTLSGTALPRLLPSCLATRRPDHRPQRRPGLSLLAPDRPRLSRRPGHARPAWFSRTHQSDHASPHTGRCDSLRRNQAHTGSPAGHRGSAHEHRPEHNPRRVSRPGRRPHRRQRRPYALGLLRRSAVQGERCT